MNTQMPLFDMEPVGDFKPPPRGLPKEFRAIIEIFDAPLIAHPGGWASTLPEWVFSEVITERLLSYMKGEWETLATQVEAMAYLYSANLVAKFPSEWADIYCWLVKQYRPAEVAASGVQVDELDEWKTHLLTDLRRQIRRVQHRVWSGKARKET